MPYGEDITISVGDAVRIHPNYKNYKFKKLKHGVTYFVTGTDECADRITHIETGLGDTILLNMDKRYFEHAGKEENVERDYELEIGDVVLVTDSGWGLVEDNIGKYVELLKYCDVEERWLVKGYSCELTNHEPDYAIDAISFGKHPMVLLNTKEQVKEVEAIEDSFCQDHYNLYYTLTEKDIKAGKIKVDAYWVAKQWKTGSRDDSGALWHSLKTIARFGEKNDKAREIKALYNQAIALARIYDVEL